MDKADSLSRGVGGDVSSAASGLAPTGAVEAQASPVGLASAEAGIISSEVTVLWHDNQRLPRQRLAGAATSAASPGPVKIVRAQRHHGFSLVGRGDRAPREASERVILDRDEERGDHCS